MLLTSNRKRLCDVKSHLEHSISQCSALQSIFLEVRENMFDGMTVTLSACELRESSSDLPPPVQVGTHLQSSADCHPDTFSQNSL